MELYGTVESKDSFLFVIFLVSLHGRFQCVHRFTIVAPCVTGLFVFSSSSNCVLLVGNIS